MSRQSHGAMSGQIDFEGVCKYFDTVVQDLGGLPVEAVRRIEKHGLQGELSQYEYWRLGSILAALEDHQPKSFRLLRDQCRALHYGLRWYAPIPMPGAEASALDLAAFVVINGVVVFIHPARYVDGKRNDDPDTRCIPSAIADSWLARTGGWGIYAPLCAWSESRRLFNHPHNFWPSIEEVLFSFDPHWHKHELMDSLQRSVPDVYVKHRNPYDGSESEWCSMRCLLDTRPHGVGGSAGDQFFVIDSRDDGVVYQVHHGDTKNIRVIGPDAVGEAMDAYCVHTLGASEDEFDFSPWSELAK